MDLVLEEISGQDISSAEEKLKWLRRVLPLLDAITISVEKEHELTRTAGVLNTTLLALKEDMTRFARQSRAVRVRPAEELKENRLNIFSRMDIALGLFILYPEHMEYLSELIPPESGFSKVLFESVKNAPADAKEITPDALDLPEEEKERAGILLLYCEHHGLTGWSDSLAAREIRANCARANKETVRSKQKEITRQLISANKEGKESEAAALMNQYQQVLKLAKMAS